MTTTLNTPVVQPALVRRKVPAAVDRFRSCACGQSLDCFRGRHCPRCDVTLHD